MRRVFLVPSLSVAVFAVGMWGVEGAALASDPPTAGGNKASPASTAGAAADVTGAQNKATAEDLYQQGMALVQKGQWAEAALKLEESNRIDPAPGTTVNLADCYEHMGRLASAWTLFVDAATVFSRRTPPDPRGEKAKTRAEALYPRLARLTVEVPESLRSLPGLVVKRDGVEVGAAQLGTGIAVDPGAHTIEATAPGKKAWTREVKVEGDAAKVSVTVEPLVDAPKVDKDADGPGGGAGGNAGPASGNGEWPWQKKAAIGVGAAGVVGLIAGGVAGGLAMGKHDELAKECSATVPRKCTANGLAIASDLRTIATVSTIGLAAGGALAAAGVVLWIAAPSSSPGTGADVKGKDARDGSSRRTGSSQSNGPRVWIAPEIGVQTGVTAGVVW